jgi:pantoate--beta-alanine ligase
MGFLHEGHCSLMRAARAACDFVVVTIFVNPLQFGAGEDLDQYPRDLSGDLALCEREGVDAVFAPSVAEMYPSGPPLTSVHVEGLTADLCGAARPTHFDGVGTVVTKLFAISGPCSAVGCPIVREPDGLARSSRNAYLSPDQRRAALVLSCALGAAADAAVAGERDTQALVDLVRRQVSSEPQVALEYVDARDAHDLARVEQLDGDVLLALAVRVGDTRLIDNVTLSVRGADVHADLGVGACAGREHLSAGSRNEGA